jgi:multidrug efflux pump subunit AcrA (membrane-fusion protein)
MRLSSTYFVCACVACLCLAGCSEEQTAVPTAPRPARVVVVTPHKLALVAQGAGRIQSRYVSEVGFEVGGRVVSRDVDMGAIVKKGQKLAELSAVDYQNKATAAGPTSMQQRRRSPQASEGNFRILLGNATHFEYDNALNHQSARPRSGDQ